MQNANTYGYAQADLQAAFVKLNQRNDVLFRQFATRQGVKNFFTNLNAWEPK